VGDDIPSGLSQLTGRLGSAVSGIVLDGSFSLNMQEKVDISSVSGQKATLKLLLKETDRGAGIFKTLDHLAFIEVSCDINSKLTHHASSDQDNVDDTFQLSRFVVYMGNAVKEDASHAAMALSSSNYKVNIHPFLSSTAQGEGIDSTKHFGYDATGKVHRTKYIVGGAVVVDMNEAGNSANGERNLEDLAAGQVTIKAANAAADAADRTFYTNTTAMEAGVLLFASIKVSDCDSKPVITGHVTYGGATGRYDGNALGKDDLAYTSGNQNLAENIVLGQNGGIQITLNADGSMEDKALAQVLTIDDNGLNITGKSRPGAQDADDFTVNLTLADLTTGSTPENVKSAVKAAIDLSGHVVQGFKIVVNEQTGHSDFSKMCVAIHKADTADGGAGERQLPGQQDGKFFLPKSNTKDADRFIIESGQSFALTAKAFANTFSDENVGNGLSGLVTELDIFPTMQIFATLVQHDVSPGDTGAPLN
jgi:hypothetical protein